MLVRKVKVGSGGRIVIPAETRHELGIEVGDAVYFELTTEGLLITTQKHALRRAQHRFRSSVPDGVSLVDELIAERREEAARD